MRSSAAPASRSHMAGETTALPVLDDGDAQPAQLSGASEPASQPSTRQAQRVPRVVAVGDVEPPRHVAHRAGEAADDDREVAVHGVRRQRDAAERGETDESAEPGRDADRARIATGGGSVRIPPATAAAEPPDEPPGVRSRLPRVGGRATWKWVRVTLTPPNSDASSARRAPRRPGRGCAGPSSTWPWRSGRRTAPRHGCTATRRPRRAP